MEIGRLVAANLKRLRLAKGLSQEQLGLDAGVHRTYISGLERGVRNPTISVLGLIAQALQVQPDELFKRVE